MLGMPVKICGDRTASDRLLVRKDAVFGSGVVYVLSRIVKPEITYTRETSKLCIVGKSLINAQIMF